jgi:hypothetical protein
MLEMLHHRSCIDTALVGATVPVQSPIACGSRSLSSASRWINTYDSSSMLRCSIRRPIGSNSFHPACGVVISPIRERHRGKCSDGDARRDAGYIQLRRVYDVRPALALANGYTCCEMGDGSADFASRRRGFYKPYPRRPSRFLESVADSTLGGYSASPASLTRQVDANLACPDCR